MSAPNPFDMNAAITSMVEHQLADRTPLIIAQALLIAGNNLRAQAFGMTAAINVANFATQPAQLADGSAIVLLTALKYVPGSYRLFVSPVTLADGSTARSILVVDENEADLLKTQFVKLSPESVIELNRQLAAVQLPDDGTIELCLAIVNQPIDGYTYFVDPNASVPTADADETDTPAPADDAAPAATDTDADAQVPVADVSDAVVKTAAPDVAPAASAGGSVADVTSAGDTAADADATPAAAAASTASDTGAGSVADTTSTGDTAADQAAPAA